MRPPSSACPLPEIEEIIGGRAALPAGLVEKAIAAWPVSPREFYLLEDDCADRASGSIERPTRSAAAGS